MHADTPRRKRRPVLAWTGLAAIVVVALSGCSAEVQRGWLPGNSEAEVTDQTGRVVSLWVGSWIAALIVGLITWGLMLWCVAVYRKRRSDDRLPVQLRYHVPLEVMYIVLPILMVGVLFFYTNRDMTAMTDTGGPIENHVQAIGKQWSWDFNYLDDDAYETGVQAQDVGEARTGVLAEQVTLWLPVDERTQFTLDSRDVIHSFWVPEFLFKLDMIPGRTNTFVVTPTRVGEYRGKCAELCGEYHSSMLFNVKVVERAEYDAHIAELKARGQSGSLGLEWSREQDLNSVNEQDLHDASEEG
ncbi:cytochrome c oxidase subunit II [Cellulomonas massiliensis]|uniref:aa3-type cytochrome oxidase subunit II n=1 Tax=Cellulomonas massiliensis TaxID=1465811 RepID=UPI000475371B|nr:cytochrome c oxidase subunit II [Cellulomonas massiliensis]